MLKTSEEFGYSPNNYPLCKRPKHNDGQATALGVYVLSDACFRGLLTQAEYPRVKAFFDREFADADISRRSVSHVLDVAGAYRAAAFVAERFGDVESAKKWKMSAEMWRRAYDAGTGLLPKGATYYEGDERNYSFRPHVGMNDRVALAGGTEKFEAMLNDFFAVEGDFSRWSPVRDRRSRPGHFEGLNNECDMNSPLSWFWVGRFDRACEVHDLVRRCRFSDGPGALPGNNDGGGTSAWYVWSCLGIYPLSGTPYVFLVSPTVERAQLYFAGGKMLMVEVHRENPKAIYPSEISFNDKRLDEPWLTVDELQKGGKLVFKMSATPAARSPVPTWL
jgi:putative alpha-1,2-mannosidase